MTTRICRACDSPDLFEILDMGQMPLAGDFQPLGQENKLYPLAIDGCARCGVLQVRETVNPDILFHPEYSYASSAVPGLVHHFQEYAREVEGLARDGQRKKVLLEIGCNDGVFLAPLREAGFRTVGIDASSNVVTMARAKGLDVHLGMFGRGTAYDLTRAYGQFDVVSCSNVMAHNPQIAEFLEAVDVCLKPRGEFWVEVHSAEHLHGGLQWDCFYHEHCFYWTLQSLSRVLAENGFGLARYKYTSMHGGAIRAVFCRCAAKSPPPESELRVEDWVLFGRRCQRSREVIRACLSDLPIKYAFGAAGRAVTLINWSGVGERLEFVVDGSPLRAGKAIPNTRVPVISETEYFQKSDLNRWCFVTAHNYLAEIRRKVDGCWPNRGTRYVTPLPYVQIQ